MAKVIPTDVSRANLDATGDDPKLSRPDLLDLVDKFNTLKAALGVVATMALGSGFSVTGQPSGTADILNVALISGFTTGDGKITLKTVPDAGWVMADDGTIGGPASGASNRGNADTQPLFELIWNNIANTWAPVSGGRGASASADFAANKTIKLGTILGRALAVAGAGAGLSVRALGEALGEEAHILTDAETAPHLHGPGTLAAPAHTHSYTQPDDNGDPGSQVSINLSGGDAAVTLNTGSGGGGALTGSTAAAGGGLPHNTMQPTVFLKLMLKL